MTDITLVGMRVLFPMTRLNLSKIMLTSLIATLRLQLAQQPDGSVYALAPTQDFYVLEKEYFEKYLYA